jgi:hypothetical protein
MSEWRSLEILWYREQSMRRLQNSIIYLLIHLTILFNIERLDVQGTSVNNIATAVYILTFAAILVIISVKWFRNVPQPVFILLWVTAYFITKILAISQRPLLGGNFTYITFTELGLFTVAVLLAQNLARNLGEVERAVNSFSLTNISRIKRVEEAQERIQAEIYRSRRFHRPLSIIILEKVWKESVSIPGKAGQDPQRAFMEEYVFAVMVREFLDKLRQTDFLLEQEKKGRLVIVSPDTDNAGIINLIERLRPLTQSELFSMKFGAATFPVHGLTFDQLLEQAEIDLQQRSKGQAVTSEAPEIVENSQSVKVQ